MNSSYENHFTKLLLSFGSDEFFPREACLVLGLENSHSGYIKSGFILNNLFRFIKLEKDGKIFHLRRLGMKHGGIKYKFEEI